MATLHWKGPDDLPCLFRLEGDSVLIGRRAECDLALPFGYISGQHAKLERIAGRWHITDLGSTNGTSINGQATGPSTPLTDGDHVTLGSLECYFSISNARAPENEPIPHEPAFDAFSTLAELAPDDSSELEKLSLLLDLQARWGEGFSADETLWQILASALKISGAERGCILLSRESGFEFAAGLDSQGTHLHEDSFRTSRSVVAKVVESGSAVVMTQGLEGDLLGQESIVAMNLRSVGCLPLHRRDTGEESLEGILYLDSTFHMHMLSGLDERILHKLAGEAETVLERMELVAGREERRTMERELELARQTQEGLLPRQLPELDGWRLQAFCHPTRQVGGDFYDFIRLPDGRIATMIADVSGKGVAASLVSSSVQGALQMVLREGRPAAEALRRLNDYLCERSEEGRFVTLFLGIIDRAGALDWASAGHNPAYLFRASDGGIEELGTTGRILGALSSKEFPVAYELTTHALQPGDLLVIYSDGLTEATGAGEELFGEDRLLELVRDHAREGAPALQARILDALEEFTRGHEQSDDITLVLAERSM